MLVKVNITATDIRLGVKAHPQDCPFARAFKRAIRKAGWKAVSVGTSSATLYVEPYNIEKEGWGTRPSSYFMALKTKDEDSAWTSVIRNFIIGFDGDGVVLPFTVEIEVPTPDEVELS